MNVNALLIAAAVSCLSISAMADDTTANQPVQDVVAQDYTYGMNLDIHKVISSTEVANVCAVVPIEMTYEDSHGQRHILKYLVMGNGCSNG